MATNYVSCPNCHSQNPGSFQTCSNCGTMLPISPMPMQPVARNYGQGDDYPGSLQAISIIHTVIGGLEVLGGAFGFIYVIFVSLITFGIGLIFIPIPLIFLIIGILSLVAGIKGLQRQVNFKLSFGVAFSQMVLLLLCDVLSFGAGLAVVILHSQDVVKQYRELRE